MTAALRVRAPAKINWTLEILGRRDDGYHELRTVLQAIDLRDTIELRRAADLALTVDGTPAGATGPVEANLALRAAELLRSRCGVAAGAAIRLEKRIPVAAGLGGGSSDAAAVLRGLRRLWSLDIDDAALAALGAELGSDVPFFIYGGTALAEGRGERVRPLADAPEGDIALLPATSADGKTARLFSLLAPSDYADGTASDRLIEALAGAPTLAEIDRHYCNSFDRVAAEAFPGIDGRRRLLPEAARLAGAGPSLFAVSSPDASLPPEAIRVRPLSRERSLAIETLDE